ncbi:hypothetical protein TWF730_009216 [Orbilia blumenaviensis]|uniref:Uncharacterized protein n=1 Tax=Orbilia blumenaviensis TaxID=1796055 RepID=A0AAV9V0W3_9PEZI
MILASIILVLTPAALAAPYQPVTTTKGAQCTYSTNTPAHSFRSTAVDNHPISSSKGLPHVSRAPLSILRDPIGPDSASPVWWGAIRSRDAEHLEVSRVGDSHPIEVTRAPPPPPPFMTITRITEVFPPEPTTVTVIPIPPPPPPPKKLHCTQRWFGTAPFCNGKCPSSWNVVRYQREAAKACDASTPDKIIDQCENTSKHGCSAGYNKALCEQCEWK